MTFTATMAQVWLADDFAPWVQALDLTVEQVTPTTACLSMPITPALARVGGIVCGQSLAALADTAMVIACAGHFGASRPVGTVTLDTQFLRPGTGHRIRCDAEIVRAGKALIFARATLIALPDGRPVATATATFFAG